VQGVSAFNRVDDVLPGKSPFPLRAMNTLKRACPHSQLGGSVGFRLRDGRKSLCHSDGNWDGGCASHYFL
jgi:hypothetical protein